MEIITDDRQEEASSFQITSFSQQEVFHETVALRYKELYFPPTHPLHQVHQALPRLAACLRRRLLLLPDGWAAREQLQQHDAKGVDVTLVSELVLGVVDGVQVA